MNRLQAVKILVKIILIYLIGYEIYLQYRQTYKNINSHIVHLSGAIAGLTSIGIVKLNNHVDLKKIKKCSVYLV